MRHKLHRGPSAQHRRPSPVGAETSSTPLAHRPGGPPKPAVQKVEQGPSEAVLHTMDELPSLSVQEPDFPPRAPHPHDCPHCGEPWCCVNTTCQRVEPAGCPPCLALLAAQLRGRR